ncbi:MAG: C-terminal binding protein [Chloroflexota bacterium]
MADMSRWQPASWGKPGRVMVVGRRGAGLDPDTHDVLARSGAEIVQAPYTADGKVDWAAAGEADMIISGGNPMGPEEFAAIKRARFVLRPYVGYDDIDVDAATDEGILVANVPDTFIIEVADHALTLLLAAQRKVLPMDKYVRGGTWADGGNARQDARPIRRLGTMTLGLVGFGNIARLVAERAKPFGLRIIATDPFVDPKAAEGTGVTLVTMDELLAQSDIISVHVFLSKQTRGLISREHIAKMKPGVIFVNTARGPLVDEEALIEALKSGHIAMAGLDVMEIEPLPKASELNKLENVVLAPHLASYSEEGAALHRIRVGDIAAGVASGRMPERKVVINKGLYDQLIGRAELAAVPAS